MQEASKPRRKARATVDKPATKPAGGTKPVRARKQSATKAAVRGTLLPAADRTEWIRVAAYFRAERRGFEPGSEMDDWIAAEADIAPTASTKRKSTSRKKTTA